MLFVNELWLTINGEGFFTGLPVKFLRLTGCNVHCCDCIAKHAWYSGCFFSVHELFSKIESLGSCQNVVISGGETFYQCDPNDTVDALTLLLTRLFEGGYRIIVETNGRQEPGNKIRGLIDWLVVSPKQKGFISCDELRLVYTGQDLDDNEYFQKSKFRYLVPKISDNQKEVQKEITKCIKLVQQHPGWRFGFPTQCFWGREVV